MSEIHFLKSADSDGVCYLDDTERVLFVPEPTAKEMCLNVEDDVIICDDKIFVHTVGCPVGVFSSSFAYDYLEPYVSQCYVYGIDALYTDAVMLSGRPSRFWEKHVCVLPETESTDLVLCRVKDDGLEPVRYSTDECESKIGCNRIYAGCVTQIETIPVDTKDPFMKGLYRALSRIIPSPLMRDDCGDDEGDSC